MIDTYTIYALQIPSYSKTLTWKSFCDEQTRIGSKLTNQNKKTELPDRFYMPGEGGG